MNRRAIRLLQEVLAEAGRYGGEIDGRAGPKTAAAVAAMIAQRRAELNASPEAWSESRRAVACLQLACRDAAVEVGPVDGLWGPMTDGAVGLLEEARRTGRSPRLWRDEAPLEANPNGWPSEAGLAGFYGPPCEARLVAVDCPWELRLDWDRRQRARRISVHEAVADSLGRVLARIQAHYGEPELRRLGLDRYGGAYNCRRKRGGSAWSTHAWGIAIDWCPGDNRLSWNRERASLARPECLDWWRFWEEEGWVSLGRSRNFDWMHVQAARL